MNDIIIRKISYDFKIENWQVEKTLSLLKDGCTIPFISRYRKDQTGNLTEDIIKNIYDVYEYQVNLLNKKEDTIRLIDEKGLLTDELKENILKCTKLVEVEDLYRPYKEKKKTKATEAIKNGLKPLALFIMSCPLKVNIDDTIKQYLNDSVKTKEDAINGACYIIAEEISDNASYRKYIRDNIFKYGIINSHIKDKDKDVNKTYQMYYDYKEPVHKIKPHRVLAINRGEKEGVLSVGIDINEDYIINYLKRKIIKNHNSEFSKYIEISILDSYKRLIFPSIQRQIRKDLTTIAMDSAISNFGKNLESLLLTPPIKEKVVLAFDPGFVNGCKIAVVDKTGKYLDSCVIKPFLKNIDAEKYKRCEDEIIKLIKKYNVDIIAIGNGTASRESERFCADIIKKYNLNCKYVIVSEAGASIYSVSDVAILEFPDLEVEKRSAVSIARRLQDPLSELVKIPPSGIGVGLYQHDVNEKKLSTNLDFVTQKCVNKIGVNINTASFSILKYISGINKKNIDKIIDYRNKKGMIISRDELKKNKILTDKAYEQSIGFLKIYGGDNLLDQTFIHPESYNIVYQLLDIIGVDIKAVGKNKLIEKLDNIDKDTLKNKLNTDIYTLNDIIEALKKPNVDPRDNYPQPILKSDILSIEDLKVGMKLQGTVRNVIDFGAFIDIGLHNDGLVHISKISNEYIKHPKDVLSVGDIVDCYVLDINKENEKVSLSLIN